MCYYKVNNKNNNEKRAYMFNVKIFSERLKAARTSKHISQADLAKAVGVSAATISSYETVNGAKIPSLDKAEAIADKLGVSLDWLCGYENKEVVDARKILDMFAFLISHLKIDIVTDGSMYCGEPRAYTLIGDDYHISKFLKEYQKIQPVLEDEKIPDYLKKGLLEALYSKFKDYDYSFETKEIRAY